MKLRLCLYLAAISAVLVAAVPSHTARRPRYGSTLRVELGASVTSLDPAVAAANPEEANAKAELDALLYDHRGDDGAFVGGVGSGAFRVSEWEAGKRAVLFANEHYREGRPFVDSVEIQMGRSAHDRVLDLELNKTDFAQIPAEQARQAADHGVRVSTSQPNELLALVFLRGGSGIETARVREAIARCIDRTAIVNFILQKEGEPAGGLLPQWSSGTAFLFSTETAARGAKEIQSQISTSPKLVLGYDSADTLEQAVAERIVVNAKEAGISLVSRAMPAPGGTSAMRERQAENSKQRGDPNHVDARLTRLRMPSPLPNVSLAAFIDKLGPMAGIVDSPLPESASPEDVYYCERSIMNSGLVVPIVWMPQVYGISARVRDWKQPAAGETWPLADVWLDSTDAR
jgi:ABC-type transport system substrate-binding protein